MFTDAHLANQAWLKRFFDSNVFAASAVKCDFEGQNENVMTKKYVVHVKYNYFILFI